MAVEKGAERLGDVVDGAHVAHLAGGDERGERGPVFGTDLVPGEERIFPCQGQRQVTLG